MRNRAKCKLCSSIIESFHSYDYVSCNCGEISIDGGGGQYICNAKDFKNFLRVDDEGNEIVVIVKDKNDNVNPLYIDESTNTKHDKEDLLVMLKDMIKGIDRLPEVAMILPVNHYDLSSALILILSIFEADRAS